jgi:hypothetical protein
MNIRSCPADLSGTKLFRSAVATILILDDDLGSAFWLSQRFAGGCEVVPARTVREAVALIGRFHLTIDLALVNPAVPGGSEFARNLRKSQGHLRVATLVSENENSRGNVRTLRPVASRES